MKTARKKALTHLEIIQKTTSDGVQSQVDENSENEEILENEEQEIQ